MECTIFVANLFALVQGQGTLVVHGNLNLPPGEHVFNPASSDIVAKLAGVPGIGDVQTGPLGVSVVDTGYVNGSETLILRFLFHNVTFTNLGRPEFKALEEVVSDIVSRDLGHALVSEPLSITHLVEDTPEVDTDTGLLVKGPHPCFEMGLRLVVAQGADKWAVMVKLCELTGLPSEVAKKLVQLERYAAHIIGDVAVSFNRDWCSESDKGGTCIIGFSNGDYQRCEPANQGPSVPMWMWWGLTAWLTLVTVIGLRWIDVDVCACCRRRSSKYVEYTDLTQPSSGVYDMIVVPGGGTTASGKPPPWVTERLLAAKQLFLNSKATGESATPQGHPWIVLQSAGTIGATGLPGHGSSMEAQANAAFLESHGIPPSALHRDEVSYNTLGNAYTARVKFLDSNQFSRVIVVTNRFHMPRTRAVFENIFDLPPFPRHGRFGHRLAFHEVADVGIGEDTLQARKQHEEQALRWFHQMDGTFRSLDAVGNYLKAGSADSVQSWTTPNKGSATRSMLPAE